jgi:trk system potassium uptake protein TrkH
MNNASLLQMAKLLGLLCIIFSSLILPPIAISWWYHDGEIMDLLTALLVILSVGMILWLPINKRESILKRRDGFLIVVLFWTLMSVIGAIPFQLSLHISFIDALFESVSGLTTTGATVLHGLDGMHPSILLYRQEIQWFGGMGLIVFALALLPMLGIGGMSLYRAEVPGPIKYDKVTPSLYKGVRSLWLIYIGLTLICALSYWLAGMTPFDAFAHSLSTVSTGGFSTHDNSLAYFHSVAIEDVADVFMLMGAINFTAHYVVLGSRNPLHYFKNNEVKSFLIFVVSVTAIVTVSLWNLDYYHGLLKSMRYAFFEVISVITSTGFGIDDFSIWPLSLPVLLLLVSFVGGCGGSTSGGIKVLRVMILFRLGLREIRSLVHPQGLFPVRLENRAISENLLYGVLGFFSIYIASFVILMLMMLAFDGDQVTAFSAIATCMNNLGPGLGKVSQTFATIDDAGKVISIIAMLLGRLEVLSVLVILHPHFWGK